MTPEEFQALKKGDTVKHKASGLVHTVAKRKPSDEVVVTRETVITSPLDWDVVRDDSDKPVQRYSLETTDKGLVLYDCHEEKVCQCEDIGDGEKLLKMLQEGSMRPEQLTWKSKWAK